MIAMLVSGDVVKFPTLDKIIFGFRKTIITLNAVKLYLLAV